MGTKLVCAEESSLLTTSEGGATSLIVFRGKGRSHILGQQRSRSHNHTHGQPLPPKSGFLSLPFGSPLRVMVCDRGDNEVRFKQCVASV